MAQNPPKSSTQAFARSSVFWHGVRRAWVGFPHRRRTRSSALQIPKWGPQYTPLSVRCTSRHVGRRVQEKRPRPARFKNNPFSSNVRSGRVVPHDEEGMCPVLGRRSAMKAVVMPSGVRNSGIIWLCVCVRKDVPTDAHDVASNAAVAGTMRSCPDACRGSMFSAKKDAFSLGLGSMASPVILGRPIRRVGNAGPNAVGLSKHGTADVVKVQVGEDVRVSSQSPHLSILGQGMVAMEVVMAEEFLALLVRSAVDGTACRRIPPATRPAMHKIQASGGLVRDHNCCGTRQTWRPRQHSPCGWCTIA